MDFGCAASCSASHSASDRATGRAARDSQAACRRPSAARLLHQQSQQRCDALAHVAPIDDHVQRAVLEQELAALEALGQRLAHGLLDDARTGEADERARLGQVEVAEHREARRHAARGRIGHDRDEGQMRLRQARERGAGLGHLQQREQRLLHARAAARGEAHERLARARCSGRRARMKRSPTTEPIEPPRNWNSKAQATTGASRACPASTISASRLPGRLLRLRQAVLVALAVAGTSADPRA